MNKFFSYYLLVFSLLFASHVVIAENNSHQFDKNIVVVSNFISTVNEEIQKKPKTQEDKRLINTAKRLLKDLEEFIPYLETEQAPGFVYYEGENYLANVIAIAEKLERINNALKYIKKSEGIDQEVQNYFQNTLEKLQSGINIPLPDYFYESLDAQQSLKEKDKIRPSAIYTQQIISSQPKVPIKDLDSSRLILAIDEGAFRDSIGRYRTSTYQVADLYFHLRIWGSLTFHISETSIAFVIAPIEDISSLTAILEEQNLAIPVVDNGTAKTIINILEKTSKREIPSFDWIQHQSTDYLPVGLLNRTDKEE